MKNGKRFLISIDGGGTKTGICIYDMLLDTMVTDVCGGSGIGLSLVKEFVSLHEGTVKVVDNVGGGSVFIVDIPVVLEKKIPASETRKTVAKECSKLIVEKDDMVITGQKNAPLVMIVDDSKDFLDFMEECFSSKYQVVCARNGEQA